MVPWLTPMALGGARAAGPYPLFHRDEVDSTSDEARRLLAAGHVPPFVVWADAQTAGRGRRGRAWQSLSGNLFASFAVRPGCPSAEWPQASFAAALAVADTLADVLHAPDPLGLKWPNDVLLGGAKVAGILLESAVGGAAGAAEDALIIGVGINVAVGPQPPVAGTSLADHGGTAPVAQVLDRLGHHLDRRLGVWETQGFAPIRADWLTRGHGRGERLAVRLGGEVVEGAFAGLDNAGALVLDQAGTMRRIVAGDVALLVARA